MVDTLTEPSGSSGHVRTNYAAKLGPLIDKPVIKLLTGMRRVGKSYLSARQGQGFELAAWRQATSCTSTRSSSNFEHIAGYRDLDRAVVARFGDRKGRKYLFVDEVQEITEWERGIASLAKRSDLDIFVTGSNARMFSSEQDRGPGG